MNTMIETAKKLKGSSLSDEEEKRLLYLSDLVGANSDSLGKIVAFFAWVCGTFDQTPAKIAQEVEKARQRSVKTMAAWTICVALVVAAAMAGCSWFAWTQAFKAGEASGMAQVEAKYQDLEKHKTFIQSSLGQTAIGLAEKGELEPLIRFGLSEAGQKAMRRRNQEPAATTLP